MPNSSPLQSPGTASKYLRELSLPKTVHCNCCKTEKMPQGVSTQVNYYFVTTVQGLNEKIPENTYSDSTVTINTVLLRTYLFVHLSKVDNLLHSSQ